MRDSRRLTESSNNQTPFTVGDIPATLESEDGVNHAEVEQVIALDWRSGPELIQGFHEQVSTQVKLTTLRRDFKKGHKRTSIQRLWTRQIVQIDNELVYDKNDSGLAWSAHKHYLDYYLLVPARRGLQEILPTSQGDPSYVFKLDLNKRQKQWKARHVDLEFDPTKHMLYIGMYAQEEVWLAMDPQAFVDEEAMEDNGEILERHHMMQWLEGSNMTLSDVKYTLMVVYLAHHLKRQGYRDIYLREYFPIGITPSTTHTVTNLMWVPNDANAHMAHLHHIICHPHRCAICAFAQLRNYTLSLNLFTTVAFKETILSTKWEDLMSATNRLWMTGMTGFTLQLPVALKAGTITCS